MKSDLISRFQKWFAVALGFGILLYVGGVLWAGHEQVGETLSRFKWSAFVIALFLALLNYVLRFVKWHYLVKRLGVEIGLKDNAWNFFAGLSMTISPGKAGELLKPYVLRKLTGTPMARTVPALITERLTDGISMLILAAIGLVMISDPDGAGHFEKIMIVSAIIFAGLLVLASERLSVFIIRCLSYIPGVKGLSPKLLEMYQAMRTCVAPVSLFWTILLSVIAWGAECVAYLQIWYGLGIDASFGACLFLYAFATVIGIPMPAGLGATDGALTYFPAQFIPALAIPNATSVILTATLLTRITTMWFGVGIGALALFKVSSMLGGGLQLQESDEEKD